MLVGEDQYYDCWDRDRSELLRKGVVLSDGVVTVPRVNRFCLDENVLNKISENECLMFAVGGVYNRFVFFHKKVVEVFERHGAQGVRFLKVSNFEDGDDVG